MPSPAAAWQQLPGGLWWDLALHPGLSCTVVLHPGEQPPAPAHELLQQHLSEVKHLKDIFFSYFWGGAGCACKVGSSVSLEIYKMSFVRVLRQQSVVVPLFNAEDEFINSKQPIKYFFKV